nr:hypothetical protein [Tanacetum cinerariifolium]
MFYETADDDLWKNQEEWILKKRRYPLTKETLERMLALRLIAEFESEAVFDLLRFIQKQIDESRSHDGSEKDLAPCYCNEALAIPEQTATDDDYKKMVADVVAKVVMRWCEGGGDSWDGCLSFVVAGGLVRNGVAPEKFIREERMPGFGFCKNDQP